MVYCRIKTDLIICWITFIYTALNDNTNYLVFDNLTTDKCNLYVMET